MSIKKRTFIRRFCQTGADYLGRFSITLKISTTLLDKVAVDLMLVIGLFEMEIRLETHPQV